MPTGITKLGNCDLGHYFPNQGFDPISGPMLFALKWGNKSSLERRASDV